MASQQVLLEENRKIRRVQLLVDWACAYAAGGRLRRDQVASFIDDVKRAVLRIFPDKGEVFELLYRPRLERASGFTPSAH